LKSARPRAGAGTSQKPTGSGTGFYPKEYSWKTPREASAGKGAPENFLK
jgi:hypothetical protein